MNVELMLDVLAKVLAAFTVGVFVYIAPSIKAFIDSKLTDRESARLAELIKTFVLAAEQLLKEEDPTGMKRKQYVLDQLKRLQIPVTDYISALIEKLVFELNEYIY